MGATYLVVDGRVVGHVRPEDLPGACRPALGPVQRAIRRIPPYITVEQSAYLLAVSPALVRKLVATGEITEACRIGSLLRIRTRPFLDRFDIPLEEAYEAVGGHAGGSM